MKKVRWNPHQLIQGVLILAGIADIVFLGWFAQHLTVRAILRPAGNYTVPYLTHGGTVFISQTEWAEHALGLAVAAGLVLGQLWLIRARRMTREQVRPGSAPASYAEVDDTIDRWVQQNGLTLVREWQGEARFWYISRGSECYQIAIGEPHDGLVTVRAAGVETDDDAELLSEWSATLDELEKTLATATERIDAWAGRARKP